MGKRRILQVQRYHQNLNRIEIEICTACNLRCRQCDRSSAQAVSSEYMTPEQVALFVDESIELGWLWYEMEILGGEPTLHPNLTDVIECLRRYTAFNPDCTLIFVTNGYGPRVQSTLKALPPDIVVENTAKELVNTIPFNSYNLAPVDDVQLAHDDFARGCRIVSECGLGLTRYGYYLCGTGASVDRVFGLGVGIRSLSEVSREKLFAQRNILCRFCGHYKGRDLKRRTTDEISESWREAYRRYSLRRPELALYGGGGEEP